MESLTPKQIVAELDKHIIGQDAAKRAVAIALRNRWRRARVDDALRNEITPKNILMIGPTGVGKTEIARRLAKLAHAPFIKVEATKFTEVGYVGRDVESIVRDLADVAVKMTREEELEKVQEPAARAAEDQVMEILLHGGGENDEVQEKLRALLLDSGDGNEVREQLRTLLRSGELDHAEIEIELNMPSVGVEIMAPPGMEEMTSQLQGLFQSIGGEKKRSRRLEVCEAMKALAEEEAANLVNEDDIKARAMKNMEQNGMVFIDELDKVTRRTELSAADVSREGVQRDLLPLVEGSTVTTRYGMVKTDHILFIASGAFHFSKPSDLIPELQGRLPIRVGLDALGVAEFTRILEEPDAALTQQYQALMRVEGVDLSFTPDGIARIAEIAWQVNETTENIGARRLHTVMERLLETLSFEAPDQGKKKVRITARYVEKHLDDLVKDEDLARYIL